MKKINIQGADHESTIMIGESLKNLTKYLPHEKVVLITDTRVRKLYEKDFPPFKVIQIGMGEKIKTLETIEHIIAKLVEHEVDRSYYIIGIGGGIVCDITGFVASIYLRGLKFGFVSTTLLAQVDASVGGKNGVNFKGYKNMVGVFNQPEFVICDLNLLKTLPEEEVQCGFAEIIKHAAIADKPLFQYLENHSKPALSLNMDVIERCVYDSVVIKSNIVNLDEKETGERRKLNFGHTLGHALEKISGISHGRAVSIGMVAASALSVRRGLLSENDHLRLKNLIKNMNLPVQPDADKDLILKAMKKDKKREGDGIHFVFLQGIGQAVVEEISVDELEEVISLF